MITIHSLVLVLPHEPKLHRNRYYSYSDNWFLKMGELAKISKISKNTYIQFCRMRVLFCLIAFWMNYCILGYERN
jgi:hypothetical protein